MMFPALQRLLDGLSPNASAQDYRHAILEANVLGKATASARLWAWKKLRELYGLDPGLLVFRSFRQIWQRDVEGRPLLALLCACTRDPILRASASLILRTRHGTPVSAQDFANGIAVLAPDRFSTTNLRAIGQRLCASWTQSGHLSRGKVRIRVRPCATPGVVSYALLLGRLGGVRGRRLFETFWAALLDTSRREMTDLAADASRLGWIRLKHAGSVVEISFPGLLTPEEERTLDDAH